MNGGVFGYTTPIFEDKNAVTVSAYLSVASGNSCTSGWSRMTYTQQFLSRGMVFYGYFCHFNGCICSNNDLFASK